MLGLYSLGFLLVEIIRILASKDTAQKKVIHLLFLLPVIAYVATEMRIITPLTKFVLANAKISMGG